MEQKNNIFIPSLNEEKKTGAFNNICWSFACLISMFVIVVLVYAPHLFLCSQLGITGTVISECHWLLAYVELIFALVFGVGLYFFLRNLMFSYKIEQNKITRGRIINAGQTKGMDPVLSAALASYMLKNAGNVDKVRNASTVINLHNIFQLISLNMNEAFVADFFDTEFYRKKEFENPRLVKDTKHALVYIDDNGKKIKIPKLYVNGIGSLSSSDADVTHDNEERTSVKSRSFLSRILLRALIILLVSCAVSFADLALGYMDNPKSLADIDETFSQLETALSSLGYRTEQINERCYRFTKDVTNGETDRTSDIKYYFDRHGNITDVQMEVYFSSSSDAEAELPFIINSIGSGFTERQITAFINDVKACIAGEAVFSRITSGDNVLRIGTSGGLVEVHNY